MTGDLFRPDGSPEAIRIQPPELGWRHLGFRLLMLDKPSEVCLETAGRESAVVPIEGSCRIEASGETYALARRGVFHEMGSVLYLPPDVKAHVTAMTDCVLAVGTAPARGLFPARLIEPAEMRVELRGGGAAHRQVNHVLAPPLPAERLIVFEVYVPGGAWAGWPPHCHDGLHGSPYLEETYYFRFDRSDGFGFQRNYLADHSFDEVFTVHDGDLVAVPRGFHVTTSTPGHTMWILNFLAGDLEGEERATPPYFDPQTTWITEDWSQGAASLPVTRTEAPR